MSFKKEMLVLFYQELILRNFYSIFYQQSVLASTSSTHFCL